MRQQAILRLMLSVRVVHPHAGQGILQVRASLSRILAAVSLGILLAYSCGRCLSQTSGTPDAANVGAPINGTFSGGGVDSVQLNNGNLHVDIPLLDLPGLGIPIHIHLIYDNKIWDYASQTSPEYSYSVTQDRTSFFLSYPGNVRTSFVSSTPSVQCESQAYPDSFLNHLAFVDEQGTAHTLTGSGYIATSPPCDFNPAPTRMYAADSSGIIGDRAADDYPLADAIMKNGTKYTFPAPDAAQGPVTIEDSNGNELQVVTTTGNDTQTVTITDTAGRVFTIVSDYDTGYQPVSISYTDQNGKPQTIGISYVSVTEDPSSLCSGSPCSSPAAQQYFPHIITLQDRSTYTLTMKPNS